MGVSSGEIMAAQVFLGFEVQLSRLKDLELTRRCNHQSHPPTAATGAHGFTANCVIQKIKYVLSLSHALWFPLCHNEVSSPIAGNLLGTASQAYHTHVVM